MNIFSKDEINHGRQLELDVAKAFAVLFMMISHVYEYMGIAENTTLSGIISYISSKITRLYVIQWLIINYTVSLMEIIQADHFSSAVCVITGIMITILCVLISALMDKIKKTKGKTSQV